MRRCVSILLFLGLFAASPVWSQDTPIVIDTVPNFIGIGIATVPDYLGSDDYGDWHVGAGVRYARLLSDAADSALVDDRGSASQLAAGVAVLYSW